MDPDPTAGRVDASQLRSPARVLPVPGRPWLARVVELAFEHGPSIARAAAIARRAYRGAAPFTPTIRLRELELDLLHRRVPDGGAELHRTSLEQSLPSAAWAGVTTRGPPGDEESS